MGTGCVVDSGQPPAPHDVRVALAVACRARPGAALLAAPDLRRRARLPAPAYVPDALVRVRLPEGEAGLVLEYDAGTEGAPYFAATKGRALAAHAREGRDCWGLSSWRPLLVTRTARRLRSLVAHLSAEGPAPAALRDDALGAVFTELARLAAAAAGHDPPRLPPASLLDGGAARSPAA